MNCPRYIDVLLEKCGSKRFYARGERHEPHAALGIEDCNIETWAPGMWKAAMQAMKPRDGEFEPIAWDALWGSDPGDGKHNVIPFALEDLKKKMKGKLPVPPDMFSYHVWSRL